MSFFSNSCSNTFQDLELGFSVTVIYVMMLDMLHYYHTRYKFLLTSKGRCWVEMHAYLWLFQSLWWLRSNDSREIMRRTLWIILDCIHKFPWMFTAPPTKPHLAKFFPHPPCPSLLPAIVMPMLMPHSPTNFAQFKCQWQSNRCASKLHPHFAFFVHLL